jgi:hypothetical protein
VVCFSVMREYELNGPLNSGHHKYRYNINVAAGFRNRYMINWVLPVSSMELHTSSTFYKGIVSGLTYLVIQSDSCICLGWIVNTEDILVIKNDRLYSFWVRSWTRKSAEKARVTERLGWRQWSDVLFQLSCLFNCD